MPDSFPRNRFIGYMRVSTHGQPLDAQLGQLNAAGRARFYSEAASRALSDRHARLTFDLFAIVKQIVNKGSQFRSIAEPGSDMATSTGRTLTAVLGLADSKRSLIRMHKAECMIRAKARERHRGRKSKLCPQQHAVARQCRAIKSTLNELVPSYRAGRATVLRYAE